MKNPLVPELLEMLRQNSLSSESGLSAHDLLQQLAHHPVFEQLSELNSQPQLQLFRKNFLLMNGLYQLQRSLQGGGIYLSVSALESRFETKAAGRADSRELEQADPVRDYFLDWSNFHETDEQDVLALLEGFWLRYFSAGELTDARARLGVEAGASAAEIKQRYRELAALHHPDKGGDEATFIEIRQAYEQLIRAIP